MKKVYVNVEELERLVTDVRAIADSEAKMVLLLGTHPGDGSSMVNVAIVCGKQEQINTMFNSTKPKRNDENKLYGKLILKAQEFVNLASSILSFKEKVYLEFGDGTVYLGVEESVRLPLHVLTDEAMPQIVRMDEKELFLQIEVGVKPFLTAIRTGSYMALGEENHLQNLGNTALVVSYNRGEKPDVGELRVYSSSGYALSKGSTTVMVKPGIEVPETMKSPSGDFMVAIPKRSIAALQKVLAGNENCLIAVSEKHIFVGVGKRTLFTFSQGSGINPLVFKSDQWVKKKKECCIVIDADNLKGKVELLNKVSDFSGKVKPLQFIFEPNKDVIVRISGSEDEGEVVLVPIEQKLPYKIEAILSGKKVVDVLNTLKKGNIRISFLKEQGATSLPVEFSNGSVEAMEEHSGVAFVAQVIPKNEGTKKVKETKKSSSETKPTETSEAVGTETTTATDKEELDA